MLELKDIVNVEVSLQASSKSVSDLANIGILSQHTRFTDDIARQYSSTTAMLEDGFLTTDFAYIAAQRVFSQNPQPRYVIVGQVTPNVDGVDYVAAVTKFQESEFEWFHLITDATDDEDKESIADYIETQTLYYWFSDSNSATRTNATTDIFSKLKAKGLHKSAGIHTKQTTEKAIEAGWIGYFSTKVIGSTSYIHKAVATLVPDKFTSTEIGYLNGKNAQYYTTVGKDSSVEGKSTTVGGEKIKAILGALWLEVRITERMWNVLYTYGDIGFTNEGIELFKAELIAVLNEAVDLGILTDEDRFEITVPDATKLTSQVRATGILNGIKFKARLKGAILFIDKIEGVVYQ